MEKTLLELSCWGNSQGIHLPKELLEKVNIDLNDIEVPRRVQFEATIHGGNICLKPQIKATVKYPTRLTKRLWEFGYTEETFRDDFSWEDNPIDNIDE